MSMYLECNSITVPVGVMVRRPNNFVQKCCCISMILRSVANLFCSPERLYMPLINVAFFCKTSEWVNSNSLVVSVLTHSLKVLCRSCPPLAFLSEKKKSEWKNANILQENAMFLRGDAKVKAKAIKYSFPSHLIYFTITISFLALHTIEKSESHIPLMKNH